MDSIIFRSLAGSNIPRSHKKSIVREWFDKMDEGPSGHKAAMAHHTGHGIRQGVESLAGGFALGAIQAETGLDIKGKIPADLLLGIAGIAISASVATEWYATEARNLAATGFSVFGFRQGYAFLAEKKRASGGTPVGFTMLGKGSTVHGDAGFEGDVGEDPIVALAREL